MSTHYPMKFTLEDGVHVEVNKTGDNTYDFTLNDKENARHFTYVDDGERLKDEDIYDFDELNAVRRFWLEQHKVM
jgi:hypothetical protein